MSLYPETHYEAEGWCDPRDQELCAFRLRVCRCVSGGGACLPGCGRHGAPKGVAMTCATCDAPPFHPGSSNAPHEPHVPGCRFYDPVYSDGPRHADGGAPCEVAASRKWAPHACGGAPVRQCSDCGKWMCVMHFGCADRAGKPVCEYCFPRVMADHKMATLEASLRMGWWTK